MDPKRFRGRVEALGNGFGLGWGSRLGAAVQAGAAGLTGGDVGETYDDALSENRALLNEERQAEPGVATALEVAGSIPSAIAVSGKGPKPSGFGARMAQALAAGGRLGGFYAAGDSQHDAGSAGQLVDAAKGVGVGMLTGGIGEAVGSGVSAIKQLAKARQLAKLRSSAEAFTNRPAPAEGRPEVWGRAEGYEQQLHNNIDKNGATWHRGEFSEGPWSGLRNEDILWPGTDRVRIPAGSEQEEALFRQMSSKAPKPSLAAGTKLERPIPDTRVGLSPKEEGPSLNELLRALDKEE
jgi:hypothetical protein